MEGDDRELAGDDPFAGLVLDEDFVKGAWTKEASARVRTERAARARAAWEEHEHRLAAERAERARAGGPAARVRRRPGRRPRHGAGRRPWHPASPGPVRAAGAPGRAVWRPRALLARRRTAVTVALIAAVVVGVAWTELQSPRFAASTGQERVPELVPTVDAAEPGAPGAASDDRVGPGEVTAAPTPRPATSDTPLGSPSVAPRRGPYVFAATQDDGVTPVAYDPCRPIDVVVNERTAPPAARGILTEALDRVSAASGLQFQVEGATDELPAAERPAFQPDRYGDRWAPVLVAWSDPAELAELDGAVAGIGGSTWVERDAGGPAVYVSGLVALDGPQLTGMLAEPERRAHVLATVVHELGHLVGLDHVDDPTQLMHAEGQPGVVDLQDGDLAGLARLGEGACVAAL